MRIHGLCDADPQTDCFEALRDGLGVPQQRGTRLSADQGAQVHERRRRGIARERRQHARDALFIRGQLLAARRKDRKRSIGVARRDEQQSRQRSVDPRRTDALERPRHAARHARPCSVATIQWRIPQIASCAPRSYDRKPPGSPLGPRRRAPAMQKRGPKTRGPRLPTEPSRHGDSVHLRRSLQRHEPRTEPLRAIFESFADAYDSHPSANSNHSRQNVKPNFGRRRSSHASLAVSRPARIHPALSEAQTASTGVASACRYRRRHRDTYGENAGRRACNGHHQDGRRARTGAGAGHSRPRALRARRVGRRHGRTLRHRVPLQCGRDGPGGIRNVPHRHALRDSRSPRSVP